MWHGMKANVYKYHHLVDGYALYSSAFCFSFFYHHHRCRIRGRSECRQPTKEWKSCFGKWQISHTARFTRQTRSGKTFSNPSVFALCNEKKALRQRNIYLTFWEKLIILGCALQRIFFLLMAWYVWQSEVVLVGEINTVGLVNLEDRKHLHNSAWINCM